MNIDMLLGMCVFKMCLKHAKNLEKMKRTKRTLIWKGTWPRGDRLVVVGQPAAFLDVIGALGALGVEETVPIGERTIIIIRQFHMQVDCNDCNRKSALFLLLQFEKYASFS